MLLARIACNCMTICDEELNPIGANRSKLTSFAAFAARVFPSSRSSRRFTLEKKVAHELTKPGVSRRAHRRLRTVLDSGDGQPFLHSVLRAELQRIRTDSPSAASSFGGRGGHNCLHRTGGDKAGAPLEPAGVVFLRYRRAEIAAGAAASRPRLHQEGLRELQRSGKRACKHS
jgi:hypothetical protein